MAACDEARVLLTKAGDDAHALALLLPDHTVSDAIVGFLAQQAVEKSLKATLLANGVRPARNHDLTGLIDALDDVGCPLPDALDDVRSLNPFAVTFRYELLDAADEEPLDRDWLRQRVEAIRSWAAQQVMTDPASPA